MKQSFRLSLAALTLTLALPGAATPVSEFTHDEVDAQDWRVVVDGVMGGLSTGRMSTSKEGHLIFQGTLSLENNGGFSSIRTGNLALDLSNAEGVVLKVRGDGRTYKLRFSTDARFRDREISFQAEFATTKGSWSEVKVPFSEFKGSFRGYALPEKVFDPGKVSRVGLILADKKPGSFELEVDWIRTFGTSES